MINKIIVYFFMFDLFLAVGISMIFIANGQPIHQVTLGNEFLSFMRVCSIRLGQVQIKVPNIPEIDWIKPLFDNQNAEWWELVLNFFVNFVNGFFSFLNVIIKLLNMLINVLNVVIQLIEMLIIMLDQFIVLKSNLGAQS